jgi:gamma-glutamyltranspeptidase/glutathione hydrolase
MQVMKRTLRYAALLLLGLVALPVARSADGPAFSKYAVAADHTEASSAGAAILQAGGNAADAAAATMLALGVTGPSGSGLGGGGFALYYRAKDKTLTFLDFRETAPAASKPDMFKARPGETPEQAAARSRQGALAIGVPGEPQGIAELVKRFGSKPLAEIVAPAEQLARGGFAVTDHTAKMALIAAGSNKDPLLLGVFSEAALQSKRATNPALADTLKRFGREGPGLFYSGALGKQILAAVKQRGGILSAQDLAGYKVVERKPLRGARLGYDWATAPLPSAGGYTIMTSLALLERWLPTDAHYQSNERIHALIESWKGPYLDRQGYFGDPDYVKVPIDPLTSPARFEARAAVYHPALALPAAAYTQPLAQPPSSAKNPDNRGTSHLCVVDREGNVASVTTTVNLLFGSGISVAGLWLNDEMDDFAREVGQENAFGLVGGAPNLPAKGKRPISSMAPSIVFKDEKPVLCIGGSGGSRIPTTVEQVALYILKDGLHPQQAVAAPRVHHQADPQQAEVKGMPPLVKEELIKRGHKVVETQWSAQVQAIHIVDGRLEAASDPGKGGEPRGE